MPNDGDNAFGLFTEICYFVSFVKPLDIRETAHRHTNKRWAYTSQDPGTIARLGFPQPFHPSPSEEGWTALIITGRVSREDRFKTLPV